MAPSQRVSGGRRFRGLSPQERQRRRRQQLIEAGIVLFGARGFHAVGVRDVCAQARLTERYFYESFQNREALFLAVYEEGVTRVRQTVVAALQNVPRESGKLARPALRAFLETLRREPWLARVLFVDVLTVSPDVGKQSLLANKRFADLVAAAVGELYPDLAERNLDVRLLANGLLGSTIYQVMHWAFGGFQEPLEHILDHCVLFYAAFAARVAGDEAHLRLQGE